MRSIIYPSDVERYTVDRATFDGTTASKRSPGLNASQFADKLVKYVPAEVIAFFLPAYALAQRTGDASWEWLVLAIGAIGAAAYAHIQSRSELGTRRPLWAYPLVIASFLGWAIGTSAAGRSLFGLSQSECDLILTIAVFTVPAFDAYFQTLGNTMGARRLARGL